MFIIKNLNIILIINLLFFPHFVFGNFGQYLPSFLRFNEGIEDSSIEKLFYLPINNDEESIESFNLFKSFEISNEERMIIEHGQGKINKYKLCFIWTYFQ
jgi:hypothetical protein